MVTRVFTQLVNGLLILVGAYVIVVYALWSPSPLWGLDMVVLPIDPGQSNGYIVPAMTVVVAEVALLAGLFSLARRSARWAATLALALAGAYLLALRLVYPPALDYPGAPVSYFGVAAPEPAIAWMSLVVGVAAVLVGVIGFFAGAVRGAISRRAAGARERPLRA